MTKKDFELIAAALLAVKPTEENPARACCHVKWAQTVEVMANRLKLTNPRFNRYSFIAACKGKV